MALEALIKPLSQLLATGTCPAGGEALSRILTGLAHPSASGREWVVSQRLLGVRQRLNSDLELVAALLATQAEVRVAWCRLLAARCREAGQLDDSQVLTRLVSQLSGAAAWVVGCLEQGAPAPALEPTPFTALERQLLGASAEHNQATPALARILAAAHRLCQWQRQPLGAIEAIDEAGTRPDINWCGGRSIQAPGLAASQSQYLLGGGGALPLPTNLSHLSARQQSLTAMEWVLANPWAYLLALIAYEQNVWQVEAGGGLLLELPAGQSPQNPAEVQVLVANREGDELLCGDLGAFVDKILSSLNMAIFPAGMLDGELNAGLAKVVGQLLHLKVWRYSEGLSDEQGQYQIHPDFSDACYGRKGQPSFSRYARHLRRVIRSQAVQWRGDRRALGQAQAATVDAGTA